MLKIASLISTAALDLRDRSYGGFSGPGQGSGTHPRSRFRCEPGRPVGRLLPEYLSADRVSGAGLKRLTKESDLRP